jgi:hypothetical protein
MNNTERIININPSSLNISKKLKKKPIISNEIKLHTNNIRQLLLDRLSQKKKSITHKCPVRLNTMDDQIRLDSDNNTTTQIPEIIQNTTFDSLSNNDNNDNNSNTLNTIKPYGNLKNGSKPTFRTWVENNNSSNNFTNNFNNNIDTSSENVIVKTPIIPQNNIVMTQNNIDNNVLINDVYNDAPKCDPYIKEQVEIKKTFIIGKNKKNNDVSILIKNNKTRKNIENNKLSLKKTNVTTLKNFLKKQNLIKFGSTAPNHLLRDIYENTKLCGEIVNENPQTLIHNFKE